MVSPGKTQGSRVPKEALTVPAPPLSRIAVAPHPPPSPSMASTGAAGRGLLGGPPQATGAPPGRTAAGHGRGREAGSRWTPRARPQGRAERSPAARGRGGCHPTPMEAAAGTWRRRPPFPRIRSVAADRSTSYQTKNCRWRPAFALETGGPSNTDGQDFDDDSGFLGRTRLGRLIQAAGRALLEKLNSARTNSPTKIFLVLLGFYTANALATILGQTGDWDVLVAGIVVAAIEGIGMLMYRKPNTTNTRPPGRLQSFISMVNYWKAGVCLGLFVDAFKLGS